jgi:hypothetical protein
MAIQLLIYSSLTAYGMYEFARDRYGMVEKSGTGWSKSLSFEENMKKNL